MAQPTISRARHAAIPDVSGVKGNARLTGTLASVLLVLLALEGVTSVRIGSLLTVHVFIGVLLIGPVLVKITSTSWRFIKYYWGDPQYRRKGPPPIALRLLGPVIVILTLILLGSGIGLIAAPLAWRSLLLFVHKASFVLWFAVMTIHVLGHIGETARLAPLDFLHRTRRQVRGASVRQWVVASSLFVGLIAAVAITPLANNWFAHHF